MNDTHLHGRPEHGPVTEHPGLSSTEARERLALHGLNELPSARPKTAWTLVREVLREPLFLLLIACGVIYAILGDYREGASLLVAILVIIGLTFIQHRRSERALEALRDLSSPRALVIRDGAPVRIAGREVVPGDLVLLAEGDRVPADGTLVRSDGMHVDTSLLTGESVPARRTAVDGVETLPVADIHAMHAGTLVTQGQGLMRVTATGTGTRMGGIGQVLVGIEENDTRLQAEMKVLIRRLGLIGIGICTLVVLVFLLTRGELLGALLAGLSSAIAILPEEFPMVLTIFLALGAWRLSRERVLTRRPSAIETLGSATVLCADKTGTITRNRMQVAVITDAGGRDIAGGAVLRHAALSSAAAPFDPMELAIREADQAQPGDDPHPELLREYPFSRETLMMMRVHRSPDGKGQVISAKGAPEAVLDACTLDAVERDRLQARLHALADAGMRVLGVASAVLPAGTPPPAGTAGLPFRFEGFIGLEDPVREEVPAAMDLCRSAGVRVIMMTGDHPATARAIARRIGLGDDPHTITGEELSGMDDAGLRSAIGRVNVFARLHPEQKLRLVQALQANGEVVAMTGDGVNDAPALKAADIGVAMGAKGTDVAREASSLVLLDDNFTSIVSAIRLGRRIYDNLQKAMDFILAVHVPIVGLALLPAFVPTLPLLLMPMHIVFLELIIDPVCALVFEGQPEERGLMERPPRRVDARFFGGRAMLLSLSKGLLSLGTVLAVYFLTLHERHTDPEVRSITFGTLLLCNFTLILTDLSRTRSFPVVLWRATWATRLILTTALVVFLLTLGVPWLRALFGFAYAGWWHYMPAFIASALLVAAFEGLRLMALLRDRGR